MKSVATSILFFFAANLSWAETLTYEVSGMHCGACAKMISKQLCNTEGLEKCDVTFGKVELVTKAGTSLTKEQVQALISKAGDYKITSEKRSNSSK